VYNEAKKIIQERRTQIFRPIFMSQGHTVHVCVCMSVISTFEALRHCYKFFCEFYSVGIQPDVLQFMNFF